MTKSDKPERLWRNGMPARRSMPTTLPEIALVIGRLRGLDTSILIVRGSEGLL